MACEILLALKFMMYSCYIDYFVLELMINSCYINFEPTFIYNKNHKSFGKK